MSRFGNRLRGSQPVSTWMRGGGTGITRIQRGTVTIAAAAASGTTPIASIDVNRSRIVLLGVQDTGGAGNADTIVCRVALTDAVTVSAFVASAATANRIVAFEVIEYLPGVIKRLQRSTLATTGSATGTAAITAVEPTRSTVDCLGFISASGAAPGSALGTLVLTDATTLTFNSIGGVNRTVGYQVVEWN